MKATGIVRKMDELGRIVIPVELRRELNLKNRTPIAIFVDGNNIILNPYKPLDIFTGDEGKTGITVNLNGMTVSEDSIHKLNELLEAAKEKEETNSEQIAE